MKFFKNIFKKVLALTCGSSMKPSKESSVKLEPIESEFSKLARDGHKFDRAKLDAMLVKLSESPTWEVTDSPSAMCYSISLPEFEQFEYVCPACGTHTIYSQCRHHIREELVQYRQGVEILRAKGLDITLDESPLCMKCRSAKELNIRGELSYDEVKPSRQRLHMLSWIINGKKVAVSLHDVDTMMTFLNGEEIQYNKEKEGWPLKCEINRLCELFGSDTVKSAITPLSVNEIFMGGRWRR